MGLPIFVPEVELLEIVDHAEYMVSVIFVEDFPFQGANFEVSLEESRSEGSTGVLGVDERGKASKPFGHVLLRSNLHDHVPNDFACAEATEGLLPHELFDSGDVLEEG